MIQPQIISPEFYLWCSNSVPSAALSAWSLLLLYSLRGPPRPLRGPLFWTGSDPRNCQYSGGALISWSTPLGVAGEAQTPPQASEAASGAQVLRSCPSSQVMPAQFVVRGTEARTGTNRRVGGPRAYSGGGEAGRAAGQSLWFDRVQGTELGR